MELSTGDIIAIGAALVTAGVHLGTLGSVKQRVARLEAGARAQGERLEGHGLQLAVLSDRIGMRRRLTAAPQIDDSLMEEDK